MEHSSCSGTATATGPEQHGLEYMAHYQRLRVGAQARRRVQRRWPYLVDGRRVHACLLLVGRDGAARPGDRGTRVHQTAGRHDRARDVPRRVLRGHHPSPGPGGYQLIGMAPAPIFDPRQELADFEESPVSRGPATSSSTARSTATSSTPFVPRSRPARSATRCSGCDFEPHRLSTIRPARTKSCSERCMAIEVLDGGLLTTVQDGGRHGLYDTGIPPSGAMDDFSYRAANLLVGNDAGGRRRSRPPTWTPASLRRGPNRGHHGRQDAAQGRRHTAADVARLRGQGRRDARVRPPREGARSYIAVAGGIDVPEVLGAGPRTRASPSGGSKVVGCRRGRAPSRGTEPGGQEASRGRGERACPAPIREGERRPDHPRALRPPAHGREPAGLPRRGMDRDDDADRVGYRTGASSSSSFRARRFPSASAARRGAPAPSTTRSE